MVLGLGKGISNCNRFLSCLANFERVFVLSNRIGDRFGLRETGAERGVPLSEVVGVSSKIGSSLFPVARSRDPFMFLLKTKDK